MEVKCQVEECYAYHDSENARINEKAQEVAEHIESILESRQMFCNCNIEEYVITLPAQRMQTVDCEVVIGCPHFEEQLIKATQYVKRNFLNE